MNAWIMVSQLGGVQYNFAPMIEDTKEEKPIVVAIASYNNEKYYKKNLNSIFAQDYQNYRIIYTNDASTDQTLTLVKNYIENEEVDSTKITLVDNAKNMGAMYNYYNMVHQCKDDEIVVCLDGDDWLAGDGALTRINQAYADSHVWVTYGNYQCFPNTWKCRSICSLMETNTLKEGDHRVKKWRFMHLRTFYAGLFKKIPVDRFQYFDGTFFDITHDVAVMFNLADLAREHMYFIPETLMHYNLETPMNDSKKNRKRQLYVEKLIRKTPPLEKVNDWKDV